MGVPLLGVPENPIDLKGGIGGILYPRGSARTISGI